MKKKILHYARWNNGYEYACNPKLKGGLLMRRDGFFNCKNCLRIVKTWENRFINRGYPLTRYKPEMVTGEEKYESKA